MYCHIVQGLKDHRYQTKELVHLEEKKKNKGENQLAEDADLT